MWSSCIDKKAIARSFGQAAATYDEVAHFQRDVGDNLMSLAPDIAPGQVLDMGCGTGYFLERLGEKYPDSSVLALDLSEEMLRFARGRRGRHADFWTVGDADNLPFQDSSINLVFTSLSIQWCSDLKKLFDEMHRVLAPEGIFMFSTLLQGTLKELEQSWEYVDAAQHVNQFFQLSEYEDAISRTDFKVQFLSPHSYVLTYDSVRTLTNELKRLGAHNMTAARPTGLTGRKRITAFLSAYERFRRPDGLLPASYEACFGVLKKI